MAVACCSLTAAAGAGIDLSSRWQRACWSSDVAFQAGTCERQYSHASSQRSSKRQPSKSRSRGGTVPGMVSSSCSRLCTSGNDSNSFLLYGWLAAPKKRSRAASSTSWPAYITATRSAIPATMPRSCVISKMAMPVSCCSFCNSSSTCACMVTSSAVVGSSAINRSGSPASAIEIMTRCFIPPDN